MDDRDVVDAATQRALAVSLFNGAWRLLEKDPRTSLDDMRLIHMAHASRYHWGEIGEPVNLARGEWMCSHVYAILGRVEPARFHAERSLELCEANGIGDFDIAYAHEALARALRLAGDADGSAAEARIARDLAGGIADAEDREHFLDDLTDLLE